ncbi:hypothetical protein [Simiduia aestuariiviva]|uniref:Uncharacterized protein n=1 Tax=Simiduia aestuariiviva TaxID=1510459 RepID=A0A839UHB6_9GAMM|nr:hypothetical protein [Simiduia aestuariiviva]MBB3166843.1 hypothetical protein [Simiduia aestuariiviva]
MDAPPIQTQTGYAVSAAAIVTARPQDRMAVTAHRVAGTERRGSVNLRPHNRADL